MKTISYVWGTVGVCYLLMGDIGLGVTFVCLGFLWGFILFPSDKNEDI